MGPLWLVLLLVGAAGASERLEFLSPETVLASHGDVDPKWAAQSRRGLEILAYVTPWNAKGYDNAATFAGKLTYVSPTWFSLAPASAQNQRAGFFMEVRGEHDVDSGWMQRCAQVLLPEFLTLPLRVRTASKRAPLIMPRVSIEGFSQKDLEGLAKYGGRHEQAVVLIMQTFQRFDFDGLVLDASYLARDFFELVKLLGTRLQALNKKLILVVPCETLASWVF